MQWWRGELQSDQASLDGLGRVYLNAVQPCRFSCLLNETPRLFLPFRPYQLDLKTVLDLSVLGQPVPTYELLVAHLDTVCDTHLRWLRASLVVGTCCGLSLSQQCLQDLLQMQRALSRLFCHLSWSAVAERWCLSCVSLCRSQRSRCSARLMKLQSCGGVSCGRNGARKVSALALGEVDSFLIQIEGFPWCFGVTDQQGSWIPRWELPNCW